MFHPNPHCPRSLEECASTERAKIEIDREIFRQAAIAGINVCHPKCQFSRTCSKKGQDVLDCQVVKANTPQPAIASGVMHCPECGELMGIGAAHDDTWRYQYECPKCGKTVGVY